MVTERHVERLRVDVLPAYGRSEEHRGREQDGIDYVRSSPTDIWRATNFQRLNFTGVEAAVSAHLDAVIIVLGDQPLISHRILNTLVATQEVTGKPLIASCYAGVAGVPALFTKDLFLELRDLPLDSGCKALIETHAVEAAFINCPEGEVDIDTPEDYARANPASD